MHENNVRLTERMKTYLKHDVASRNVRQSKAVVAFRVTGRQRWSASDGSGNR